MVQFESTRTITRGAYHFQFIAPALSLPPFIHPAAG
jgi:hypothetical protein